MLLATSLTNSISRTSSLVRGCPPHSAKRSAFERLLRPRRSRMRPKLPSSVACSQLTASEFQEWLVSTGETFQKLSVEADARPCLVADEGLKTGEKIVTFTQDKWISLDTVGQSRIGSTVKELDPWLQLALFLLLERADSNSPWQPFMSSLPAELASPAFWSDEELAMIEGTQLHETAVGYRQFFRQKYEELETQVFKENADLFASNLFDYASFCWAVGIVRSQVHAPLNAERIALVPAISLIGHSRDGNVELVLNSGNLFNPVQTLTVETVRDISSGEQLTMNYDSDKSDSRVALDYGVVDLENRQGGYELSLRLPDSDPNYDDKLDVMDICGMEEPLSFEFRPYIDPPQDLLVFLRLLNMSGPDAFHLEAIFRNEIEDHLTNPISPENETNLCESMISGCEQALEAYRALKNVTHDSPKQALMIQVCQGEQETLEWIQSWFLKRKEQLSELEYYAERRLKRLGLLDDDGQSTFEDMWKDGLA